jgi:hypothetical protein
MTRLVLVLVLMGLGGCAQWSKPGGTEAALSSDQSACNEAALRDFPPELSPMPTPGVAMVQPGYACLPGRGCVPTGTAFMPPGDSVSDRTAAPRTAAFDRCMIGRGWTK